jgi:hypothetical protein
MSATRKQRELFLEHGKVKVYNVYKLESGRGFEGRAMLLVYSFTKSGSKIFRTDRLIKMQGNDESFEDYIARIKSEMRVLIDSGVINPRNRDILEQD